MQPSRHPEAAASAVSPALAGSGPPPVSNAITPAYLHSLDPVEADRQLPRLVESLSAADDETASIGGRVLSRHPLFAFRRGTWPAPQPTPLFWREFFPNEQIADVRRALIRLVETAPGPVRDRLVETYAHFPGLDNLVDGHALPWRNGEREQFEYLVMQRDLLEFRPQLTVVLSYQCNQRCPYCFSEELSHRLSRPITWEHFLQTLEWGRRAGVSRVPVTGGEPTLHPEFARFMGELRARNLATCFSTNGCVPRAQFECLSPDFVETITFHILDDAAYGPGQVEQLEENIRCVRDLGIRFVLRYVLAGSRPPARYLDLAARYRPWLLTFSPVFPGPDRHEMNRDVRALFEVKDDILRLAEAAVALGIRPVVAKPIPLCMFSRKELLRLAATTTLHNVCDVSQNGYTNNTLVTPDLSLYPCMALPLTGATLADTLSMEAFSCRSRAAVEPLLQQPMLDECPQCQLFQMRLCQPACLAFGKTSP